MRRRFSLLCLLREEEGQVLPWMVLLMVLFLGMAGLTVDLGHAYVAYRELQGSTDAAALAGAYAMGEIGATPATVYAAVCAYSSNTDTDTSKGSKCSVVGNNGTPNLPVDSVTPLLTCVGGVPYVTVPCGSAPVGGKNVIQVTQTATVPTYFIQALSAFGLNTAKTLTLNAMSSATISGSTPPVAVAILIDTTNSMGQPFSPKQACGTAPINCALGGLQTLLEQVPTCAQTDPTTGACTQHNYVGLFTFPTVDFSSVSADTNCSGSGQPSVVDYTYATEPLPTDGPSQWNSWTAPTSGATYEIAGFSDNFNTGTGSASNLNTSSPVAAAAGAGTCTGMQAKGGVETYYAGAIETAQAALLAQVDGNTSIQKVMIILSDGAANSTHIANPAKAGGTIASDYGSTVNECQQAIWAAQNATLMGTTVYTIAYGSEATGCTTDVGGGTNGKQIAPCQTMQQMASTPSDFYSEAGSAALCGTTGATLPQIFSGIVGSFSKGRLIPNTAGS
jgi:hypothetical protein